MKPLDNETNFAEQCADQLHATLPLVMRVLREEMDSRMPEGLTPPQFMSMGYLNFHGGVSISDMADHLRLTLPTISKLVDGLVERGLVIRETASDDRRRVTLELSDKGRTIFEAAHEATRNRLAEIIGSISRSEQKTILEGLRILGRVFLAQHSGDRDNPFKPRGGSS